MRNNHREIHDTSAQFLKERLVPTQNSSIYTMFWVSFPVSKSTWFSELKLMNILYKFRLHERENFA